MAQEEVPNTKISTVYKPVRLRIILIMTTNRFMLVNKVEQDKYSNKGAPGIIDATKPNVKNTNGITYSMTDTPLDKDIQKMEGSKVACETKAEKVI